MSNRKVKINFTLVGKSFRNLKEIKDEATEPIGFRYKKKKR